MKILVSGNCQARGIHHCLQRIAPTANIKWLVDAPTHRESSVKERLKDIDVVFCQTNEIEYFRRIHPATSLRILDYPLIWFEGYHPDMTYVWKGEQPVTTPTADYSSAIIFFAHQNCLSVDDAYSLFNERVFERLGYFRRYLEAKERLIENFEKAGFAHSIANQILFAKGECPMLTFNHPRLKFLFMLAIELLQKVDVKPELPQHKNYLIDHYLKAAVWGVYPEIAKEHSIEGGYFFKSSIGQNPSIMGLKDYIRACYGIYAEHNKNDLHCPALHDSNFSGLADLGLFKAQPETEYFSRPLRAREHHGGASPFDAVPEYQYWRRELKGKHPAAIDLQTCDGLHFDDGVKIATGGSCFAQQITRYLRELGCSVIDSEPRPDGTTELEAANNGYGIYSARYGNIYTARQLYQLIARAAGIFSPKEHVWRRSDGAFVDPFRPLVFRNGFKSAKCVQRNRKAHLSAVSRVFQEADVYIFTLGLTEAWYAIEDGSVFPVAPGILGGDYNSGKYSYKNFMPTEIVSDLVMVADLLRTFNAKAKLLLTVSPVPLIATYESRSAIISNCYTKSALRAAAEEASNRCENVHYFPSFELVSGHHLGSHYYDEECRGITRNGVERVARAFVRKYFKERSALSAQHAALPRPELTVLCDEAELEKIFETEEGSSDSLQ